MYDFAAPFEVPPETDYPSALLAEPLTSLEDQRVPSLKPDSTELQSSAMCVGLMSVNVVCERSPSGMGWKFRA
ncbi:hypothetical protein AVEN_18497-1, partial [Araneus ventricosus]